MGKGKITNVTKKDLGNIAGLVLGFLNSENMGHLDYIEENQKNFFFPLDPGYKYFLGFHPKRPYGGEFSTVLRCVSGKKNQREESEYDELENSFLYAILDDSKLGSLMVVKCEDLIKGYSPKGFDRYQNLIQRKILGTERNSPSEGTRLLSALRVHRLEQELKRLSKFQ